MKNHQRKIRDIEQQLIDPRPQDTALDYHIEAISADEAREFILRYEWLGTVGNPIARYGARNAKGELAAVALFGKTGGDEARNICGPAYIDKTICLERGACAHWAHPHAASWFITRVCKQAALDHGWQVFYAYSDMSAGEIGTVYQACGWRYLGQGVGHGNARAREYFRHPVKTKNKWISEKALRTRRGISIADALKSGWQRERRPAKHKYVQFVGDKRECKAMRDGLIEQWLLTNRNDRHIAGPYPKRPVNDD